MFIKNLKNNDWYLNFVFFYIFITPWHISKSQTSVLSIILLIWTIIKYKKEIITKLKEYIIFLPILLLILFICYSYLSSLWSNPIKDGFEHVNTFYKYYFLFIPAILVSMNKENAIKAIKILTISFGFYAVYSILIYLGLLHIDGSSVSNPRGHLRFLIISQYFSISFFISSIFLFYSTAKSEKILFFIIALISFFALFINNSRTAQLSFLLIIFIFSILHFKKYILNLKYLFIIFLIFSAMFYTLYENNKLNKFYVAYQEVNNLIKNNEYKGSVGLRLYFNEAGAQIFTDNVLFGTGPNDNRQLLQKIQKEDSLYNSRIINHFHSEHMDKLTAYGIVGYSLLFFAIAFLIYKLKDDKLTYYIGLSVFLTLFFNSFANKTLSVKPLTYVYIIFFILLAIIAYNKDKNLEEKI